MGFRRIPILMEDVKVMEQCFNLKLDCYSVFMRRQRREADRSFHADVNECEDPSNPCAKQNQGCFNLKGSFRCNRYKSSNFFSSQNSRNVILLGVMVGFSLLFPLFGVWWLCKALKRRKKKRLKEKFFKRNGGLLLQEQLSTGDGNVQKVKLFTSKELDKASNNYNASRLLGQGAQGTVYKGMLDDGRIVAVKKSMVLGGGKLKQFINEVVILSQINHRHVVALLGCCLETEVPLLVYEFVPNGTLHQFLHNQSEELVLTWDVRLRIATEVSGALSYLHSAASMPIYHRDVKSKNILLDAKYRAKVADFGTSRSIKIDATHLTTRVEGTFGYMDPEYYQSNQYTEKSDVYSFGVVLFELLTRKKPVSSNDSSEEVMSHIASFILSSKEEARWFEMIDPQVLKEARKVDVLTLANLTKKCVSLTRASRPTMKEVTMVLEGIPRESLGSCINVEYDNN
ncbi:unnamed protein product [Linum tenue]|uniref:Protein kinase domain-containing protein n=1 Tax=Linum tenue TaxID=586396 RepID=A0AAV0MYE9_9ROSI|nr:unnamed protein product [Linum tenue]